MKKLKNNILFQSCNLTKIIDSKTKKINYGIELLRFLLCFWIVVYHCSYIKPEHKKILTRTFHVPTFFLMAFYFYFPYFSKRKISKIISRFERLLIPYVIWPILILIMNNYLMEIISFAKIKKKRNITFKEFYIQILVADSYHPIFFFQFNFIFNKKVFIRNTLIFRSYIHIYKFIRIKLHIFYKQKIQINFRNSNRINTINNFGLYLLLH